MPKAERDRKVQNTFLSNVGMSGSAAYLLGAQTRETGECRNSDVINPNWG